MTITKQDILDAYNSVYSQDNEVDKTYEELTKEEKIEAELIYLNNNGGGGGGDASAANQETQILRLEAIRDRLSKPFRLSANFTRPANTTQYTVKDAITNSTSSPTVFSFDFSSFGASNSGFFKILNARVISDIAQATLPLINIVLFNVSFTATNDNSPLSIDDTTAQTGGIVIPCYNTYDFNANSRCVSDPGAIWQGRFSSSNTTLYGVLQAANNYTPGSGERFDVILEGEIL